MKKISVILSSAVCLLLMAACTQSATSYSNELKAEKQLINEYVKRNNINIIYEEPEYDQWGKKDYLEVGDYCYFHLNVMGDTTTAEVETKDNILMRYRRYTLDANADTISYWNTNELAYPIEFQYNVSSTSACTAWHYAVAKMKYTGAECTIIVPSKLGSFDSSSSDVTPYVYDLKMQIKRF